MENKKCEKYTLGWLREQAKKDGFDSLTDWNNWKRQKNIEEKVEEFKIRQDFLRSKIHLDELARKRGYDDNAHYDRERVKRWQHNTGICKSREENWACSQYIGIHIGENKIGNKIIPVLLEEIERHVQTSVYKFDFLLKSGIKVDIKTRVLSYRDKRVYWNFPIRHNNVPDYFILIGLDDIDNQNIIHVWLFKRNDLIRNREFWDREDFTITNREYHLSKLMRFDVTKKLGNLKDLINYDD